MLTGELLRFRVKDGRLLPQLLDPNDPKHVRRATDVLDIFAAHVGAARGELDEALESLTAANDAKLVKGLIKTVFDQADLEVQSVLPPAEIREVVFRAAALMGPLGTVELEGGPPTVRAVYARVAEELGVDAAALEAGLYADDPDAMRVMVEVPTPDWLIHRYNVALVQAALYGAEALTLTLTHPGPGRLRQLLRAARFHQLIHHARPVETGYELIIDGPASLFKQGSRYGLALAKFFPAILLIPDGWSMRARVPQRGRDVELRVDPSHGLRSHYRDQGAYETREAQWFAERFEALQSGWELRREAPPLQQGGEAVVVPDFSFHKDGRVAWLEILGFWRKATLETRLAATSRHGPRGLVLAVSKKMSTEAQDSLPEQVVPFAEVIPAKKVLQLIEQLAEREGAPHTPPPSTKGVRRKKRLGPEEI